MRKDVYRMMTVENYIDLSKCSKAQRRAYYAKQRGSWNGVNPVTRVVPNKKAYDRNRMKSQLRREA